MELFDTDKPIFKICIAGSRCFNDYEFLKRTLDKLVVNKKKTHRIVIVSGGAKGADTLGEKYAKERRYEIMRFIPDWNKYGKRAGIIRNSEMAVQSDAAVIFIVNESKGSMHMKEFCEKLKIPLRVYNFNS